MPADERQERLKALEVAVGQIEKQFGKGSIMRLGAGEAPPETGVISTGALSVDIALSVGGDYSYFSHDPNVFWLYATPLPGQTPEALERILLASEPGGEPGQGKKGGAVARVEGQGAVEGREGPEGASLEKLHLSPLELGLRRPPLHLPLEDVLLAPPRLLARAVAGQEGRGPLAEAEAALTRMESGEHFGKLVLAIG